MNVLPEHRVELLDQLSAGARLHPQRPRHLRQHLIGLTERDQVREHEPDSENVRQTPGAFHRQARLADARAPVMVTSRPLSASISTTAAASALRPTKASP